MGPGISQVMDKLLKGGAREWLARNVSRERNNPYLVSVT